MPGRRNASLKDPELHEELRDGASKEKAARRAKELGLTGYSGKRKSELISALRDH